MISVKVGHMLVKENQMPSGIRNTTPDGQDIEVSYGPMGKGMVLVGDMWLNQDQLPSETTIREEAEIIHGESSPGVKEEWRKWPNRILYYQLSRRLPTWAKNDIKQALRNLQNRLDSCIRFEESPREDAVEDV